MRHRRRSYALIAAALIALAGSSCGYFNSLYNAHRQFDDAERARRRGDVGAARGSYTGSIEKAAKSYRKYPHGRWSDDALYLIARARFHLGEYTAARAAFTELLNRTQNKGIRAAAQAYAGAANLSLAAPAAALVHLDSAVAQLDRGSELTGFAHLWRARAHLAIGNEQAAWADLDAVGSRDDAEFEAIQLERISLGIANGDTSHVRDAFARFLTGRDVRRSLDTLNALARQAGTKFGAENVRAMLADAGPDWAAPARDSLALIRARVAAEAGDTLFSNRELLDLTSRASRTTAAGARVALAQTRLKAATSLDQFAEIRAFLLPAIADVHAQEMIRTIRLVDVLVRRSAETAQPLALFAAAEAARDQLGADQVARQLFLTFADVGAQTPWAGKALLAALAIAPNAPDASALRTRLSALPANPYTNAVRGDDAVEAYDVAEERLGRSLAAVTAEASQLAAQQETGVTHMISALDSIQKAAHADTVRVACGVMVDTLSLVGIRADSVRSACLRGEKELVADYIKIDTVEWIPAALKADSADLRRRRRPTTIKRDTIIK